MARWSLCGLANSAPFGKGVLAECHHLLDVEVSEKPSIFLADLASFRQFGDLVRCAKWVCFCDFAWC